ncbi:MAG TPA: histidine phosphatase family protein [Burkholderiaceae bacterium]|nr:histidine phosphatase family protein [Burkholderiaceae bacterium]
MTELILVRHGETDWNRELRFQGQSDVPLNAVGHEQARRVGVCLAGETVHHLVCSDLTRTRQTAMPAALQLGLDSLPDAALREQNFGVVDGLRIEDIKAQFPDALQQWVKFQADYSFGGGESTRHFHPRVMKALWRLAAAYPAQTLLVVTHGGVLDMVYRTAQALPLNGPRQADIPNGGINRVRMSGAEVQILSWAETQHLADMPPQPIYDQTRSAKPPT